MTNDQGNEISVELKDGHDGKLVEIFVPPRLLTAEQAMMLAGRIAVVADSTRSGK